MNLDWGPVPHFLPPGDTSTSVADARGLLYHQEGRYNPHTKKRRDLGLGGPHAIRLG
jgi:hypothetical protein